MSKTDTWMPLYIGDYLADTMRLTIDQHGAYLLLLMEYWRQGPLPDDDAQLACIVKVDRKRWDRELKQAIRRFFTVEGDGLLHQKRLDTERQKAAELSAKRSDAANKRYAKPSPTDCKPDAIAHQLDTHAGVDLQSQSQLPKEEKKIVVAKATKADRSHRLPDDWEPTGADLMFAKTLGLDAVATALQFRDYWHSSGTASAKKTNWVAAWRFWCRNQKPTRPGNRPNAREQSAIDNQTEIDRLTAELTGRPTPPPYDGPTIEGELL
jgi:uncharacterized protein YdaU (DUF1376 family)